MPCIVPPPAVPPYSLTSSHVFPLSVVSGVLPVIESSSSPENPSSIIVGLDGLDEGEIDGLIDGDKDTLGLKLGEIDSESEGLEEGDNDVAGAESLGLIEGEILGLKDGDNDGDVEPSETTPSQ